MVCNVEVKDDNKTKSYQMDGKGIYVGETSRSMYECGKEHQKDKQDRTEESHQVKHWQIDHPEMEQRGPSCSGSSKA